MTIYLLDTNHASTLVTLHHPVRRRVLHHLEQGDVFALCIPVIVETVFGIGILPRAIENRLIWDEVQHRLPCYVHDIQDALNAADLQIALRRRGRQLATVDALIATIALRHDLVLLTTDRDFEAVPVLIRENWYG